MSFDPKTGTDGLVKAGGTTVAGITSWNVNESTGVVPLTNFTSSANADGVVYADKARGVAEWSVDLEGIYNSDATDNTEQGTPGLRNGRTVTLKLYGDKTNSRGYDGAVGFVTNFTRGVQINNTAFTFKCTVTGTSTFPAYGAVA